MNYTLLTFTALFMLIDVVTGLTKALKNKNFSSSKMRNGLYNKIGEVLAVAFSVVCEYASVYNLGIDNLPLFEGVNIYIIIMEVSSIIENIVDINPGLKELFKKGGD